MRKNGFTSSVLPLHKLNLVAVRIFDKGNDGGAVFHRPGFARDLATAQSSAEALGLGAHAKEKILAANAVRETGMIVRKRDPLRAAMAFIHHDDEVGMLDGRQAMRDDERRAVGGDLIEPELDGAEVCNADLSVRSPEALDGARHGRLGILGRLGHVQREAVQAGDLGREIVRRDGATLAIDAPLFDDKLTTPNSDMAKAVTITAGDGTTAPAFVVNSREEVMRDAPARRSQIGRRVRGTSHRIDASAVTPKARYAIQAEGTCR